MKTRTFSWICLSHWNCHFDDNVCAFKGKGHLPCSVFWVGEVKAWECKPERLWKSWDEDEKSSWVYLLLFWCVMFSAWDPLTTSHAVLLMTTVTMQLLLRFASIHQTGNDLQEDPTTRGSEPLNGIWDLWTSVLPARVEEGSLLRTLAFNCGHGCAQEEFTTKRETERIFSAHFTCLYWCYGADVKGAMPLPFWLWFVTILVLQQSYSVRFS